MITTNVSLLKRVNLILTSVCVLFLVRTHLIHEAESVTLHNSEGGNVTDMS